LSTKKIAIDKDILLKSCTMKDEALLSTAEVAARLEVTRQRVLELIGEERLPAIKVGRSYVVRADDLASLTLRRVGRPATKQPTTKKVRGKK
jgi:excisionase family DNA binding protein